MTKLVGTQGSGITEKGIVKFDVAFDLAALVAAANHSMTLESFASIQRSIGDTAKNVLAAVKLPWDIRGIYDVKAGTWHQVGGVSPSDSYSSYISVFSRLEIPPDSPAGYAAQALVLLDQIGQKLADRQDEALALAFELGGLVKEATLKAAWEADALRGEKTLRSAETGAAITHGSQEQRARKTAAIQADFEVLVRNGKSPMDAYRLLGKKYHRSFKTIQRKIQRK